MAPEVIACEENPDSTYDYRVSVKMLLEIENMQVTDEILLKCFMGKVQPSFKAQQC